VQPEDLQAVADVIAQAIQEALAPVLERLTVLETRVADLAEGWASIGPLRERLAIVETKAAPVDLDPVLARLAAAEFRVEVKAAETSPLLAALADLTKDIAALRERAAVLETRAPMPGPAGQNGHDGRDGTDGAAGVGFEDLAVEFDGDRTLAFRFERGAITKVFPIALPFLRYQGVYQEGKAYDVGDTVTWAGAMWHCQAATIAKPGDSTGWQLCVSRGRDGKAGKDGAPAPLPVVTVGGSR
jgi:hypothetical protein